QGLDGGRELASRRFTDQQRNVFRHDDVSQHYPAITLSYLLQNSEEQVAAPHTPKQPLPVIATESEEVQIVSAVPALQAPRHALRLHATGARCRDSEHITE